MPSLALPVTLAEVLEVRGAPLGEAELWGVLCQGCLSLRDRLHQGQAFAAEGRSFAVCPDAVLLSEAGKVSFGSSLRAGDMDNSFVAPEAFHTLPGAQLDVEKMYVYSFGSTLLYSAEYGLQQNQAPAISADLALVLQAMCEDNPSARTALDNVLEACHLYGNQHSKRLPFSHFVIRLHRAVLGDPDEMDNPNDSSYGSDQSRQSTLSRRSQRRRSSARRSHRRHRQQQQQQQRDRSRSRSASPPSRSRSRSRSRIRGTPSSGYTSQPRSSQQLSTGSEGNHPPAPHHSSPVATATTTAASFTQNDHPASGASTISTSAAAARPAGHSPRRGAGQQSGLGQDKRSNLLQPHGGSSTLSLRSGEQTPLSCRQGGTAYEKYLRLKERQRKLRRLRYGEDASGFREPLLLGEMAHRGGDLDARSMASALSFTLENKTAAQKNQGTFKPDAYAQYGSQMGLQLGHESERDHDSIISSDLSFLMPEHSLRAREEGPTPTPSTTAPLTPVSQTHPKVRSTPQPLVRREVMGPEFVHKGSKPLIRIPMPLQGESLKNPSHLRRVVLVHLTGQKYEALCDPSTTGRQLFEAAIAQLGLAEFFYFGLTYISDGEHFFLDPDAKLHKSAPEGWREGGKGLLPTVTFTLYLRVKFYVDSISDFRHNPTHHLLYLQLRRDVLEDRSRCSPDKTLELAGLALQAECGDYDQAALGQSYFVPEQYVPQRLVRKLGTANTRDGLIAAHRKCRGIHSSQAEIEYIKHVQKLEEYGTHYYKLQKSKGESVPSSWLGVRSRCLVLVGGVGGERLEGGRQLAWHAIDKISFNKRRFSLQPKPDLHTGVKPPKINLFTNSYRKGRYLLQLCTAQHRFLLQMRSRLNNAESFQGGDMEIEEEDGQELDLQEGSAAEEEGMDDLEVQGAVGGSPESSRKNSSLGLSDGEESVIPRVRGEPPQYRSPPQYRPRLSMSMGDLPGSLGLSPLSPGLAAATSSPLASGMAASASPLSRDLAASTSQLTSVPEDTTLAFRRDGIDRLSSMEDDAYVLGMSLRSGGLTSSQPAGTLSETLLHRFQTECLSPRTPGRHVFEVTLEKDAEHGVGLTIVGGENTSELDLGIFIKSLTPGGPAARCGLLKPGDRLIAIQGVSLEGVQHTEAVRLIRTAPSAVTLTVSQIRPPASVKRPSPQTRPHPSRLGPDRHGNGSVEVHSVPRLHLEDGEDLPPPPRPFRGDDGIDGLVGDGDLLNSRSGALDDLEVEELLQRDFDGGVLSLPVPALPRVGQGNTADLGGRHSGLALENDDEDVDSELGSYLGLEGEDSGAALARSLDSPRQTPPSKPPRKRSPQPRGVAGSVTPVTQAETPARPRSAGTKPQSASAATSRLGVDLTDLELEALALSADKEEEDEEKELEALQILGEIADQPEDATSSDSDFEEVVQAAIEGKPRVRRSADDNFGDGYVDKRAKDGDTALIEMMIDKEDGSLGFTITGGTDSSLKEGGVYVKSVLPNSRAARLGVQRGDRLLSVGGVPLMGVTHRRAVEVLRAAPTRFPLTLQRGLYPPSAPLPPSSPDLDSLPDLERRRDSLVPGDRGAQQQQQYSFVRPDNTFEVTLQRTSSGLGFSFQGGHDFQEQQEGSDPHSTVPRIKKVFPLGPAAESGQLRAGDVILEVNHQPLQGLSRAGIIQALRTPSKEVTLLMCRPDPADLPPLSGSVSEDSLESLFRLGAASTEADLDLQLYDSDSSRGNTLTPPSQFCSPRSSQEVSPRSIASQDPPPPPDAPLSLEERIPSSQEEAVEPVESAARLERDPEKKKGSPREGVPTGDRPGVVESPRGKQAAREEEGRRRHPTASSPSVVVTTSRDDDRNSPSGRDEAVLSSPLHTGAAAANRDDEWDFTSRLATPPKHKPPPAPDDDDGDWSDEEPEMQKPQVSPRGSKNQEKASTPTEDAVGVRRDLSYQFDRASQRSLQRQENVLSHEDEGQGGADSKLDRRAETTEPATGVARDSRAAATAAGVPGAEKSASGTDKNACQEQPVERPQELEVTLEKNEKGSLGFTVAGGAQTTGGCYIKGIIDNPALSDGRLQPGDRLIRVNDTDMSELSHAEAVNFLRQAPKVVKIEVLRLPLKLPKTKSGRLSTESSGATGHGKPAQKVEEAAASSLESSPGKDESPSESVSRPPRGPAPRPSPAAALTHAAAAAPGAQPPPDAPPLPPSAVRPSRPPEESAAGKADAACSKPEEDEEKTVHQITLVPDRGSSDLGFTLVTAEQDGELGCYVRSIAAQGPAEKDGRLMVGDKIIEVNGMPVKGLRRQQVLSKLKAQQPGEVQFSVLRNENEDEMPVIVESDSEEDVCGEPGQEEEDDDDDDISAVAAEAARYLQDMHQLSLEEARIVGVPLEGGEIKDEASPSHVAARREEEEEGDAGPDEVPAHITERWLRSLPLLRGVGEESQERMMAQLQELTDMVEEDLPAEEFQALRQLPATDECEFAKRPENKPKNRYRNVLPYDQGRVVLSGEEPYINASRIVMRVGEENLEYLACQGPLPNTARDFWRLVWDSGSDVIAMLTLDMEARKVKCHRYWPDTPHKPLTMGELSVRLQRVQELEHFNVRHLLLRDETSGQERPLVQVNYTTWPDHGVPDTALPLLQYLRLVHLLHKSGPLIVHCSAGIGRTGVFITMDTALRHIEKDMKFYICNIVTDMRKQRYGMVQTKDQYQFCYTAVMEALLSVACD